MKDVHILLVEDNEGDIMLMMEAFEECKIKTNISIVKNGKAALNFLYKKEEFKNVEKPDLILLDLNIPIYKGLEVLKKIKEESMLKKIPVIVLTTSSNPAEIEEAYRLHANSYIVKPIEMEEFIKTIFSIEEFWLRICKLSDD